MKNFNSVVALIVAGALSSFSSLATIPEKGDADWEQVAHSEPLTTLHFPKQIIDLGLQQSLFAQYLIVRRKLNTEYMLQIPVGCSITPHQLYLVMQASLNTRRWKNILLFSPPDQESKNTYSSTDGDSTYVIAPPMTDAQSSHEIHLSGGISLEGGLISLRDVIATGKIATSKIIIYIPLAQSNPLFGVISRKHFTLLEIKINGEQKTVTHIDPAHKLRSGWYSLEHIRKNVEFALPDAVFQTKYLSWQGIFKKHDCGRFVFTYIHSFLNPNGNYSPTVFDK